MINNLKNNELYSNEYEAIVIGASAGGFNAFIKLLPSIPLDFPIPVIIVQHIHPNQDDFFVNFINQKCQLTVKEINDKEQILPGFIFVAPPNYHVLVEDDKIFSLSIDEKINCSRPSIDLLFESAAEVFRSKLIGIILTGANSDGALGMKKIKEYNGITIVQNPEEAESNLMPISSIDMCSIDHILELEKIPQMLVSLTKE